MIPAGRLVIWYFQKKKEHIDIYISYIGTHSLCPHTDKSSPIYDHRDNRRWCHLNFLEYTCYIHCLVPRVKSSAGVKPFKALWANQYDHFTHAFAVYATKVLRSTKTANPLQCSFRIIQRIRDREAKRLL